jgi:hypothetical protein
MGPTYHSPSIQNTCDPVSDQLLICDPGGVAYHDDVVHRHDLYLAHFHQMDGELLWSTAYGDHGWLAAIFDPVNSPSATNLLYEVYQQQPFPIYRFSDLKSDRDDNLFGMTLFHHGVNIINDYQSTVYGHGMYNQPFNSATGNNQTDVFLFSFTKNRELVWSSFLGGGFDHVWQGYDDQWVMRGSDFGQDLALVSSSVLYVVGSTGGVHFPSECPVPGSSWCESPMTSVGDHLDPLHGFMTRISLANMAIGMNTPDAPTADLLAYPNPAADLIMIRSDQRSLAGTRVAVTNIMGQQVLEGILSPQGALNIASLSPGLYSLRVTSSGEVLGILKFIKE